MTNPGDRSPFDPNAVYITPEQLAAQDVADRYGVAMAHEEPSISPRIGGWGPKAGWLLDILDDALKLELPGMADFAEQIVTDDLKYTAQGQVEGFARLARHYQGDPEQPRKGLEYLHCGLGIATALPGEARLAALSKLMKIGGELDPAATEQALEHVAETNHHRRFLEISLALSSENPDLLDRVEVKAAALRQLDRGVSWSLYTVRIGFVGPLIGEPIRDAITHARQFLEIGMGKPQEDQLVLFPRET